MTTRAAQQRTTVTSDERGRFLYWWLLVALVFEYARPGSFAPVVEAVKLNTIIPVGLLFATLFAKGLRSPKEILADPFSKLLFVYVGLIVFSLSYAEVTLYAYDRSTTVLGYLILFWLIARIVTSRARLLGIFFTLIVAHVFLIAMNPEVVLDPATRHYINGATFLGDGNDFALSICILIPFALELAFSTTSKWARILHLAIAALLLFAVIGTSSRGGSLGLVAVAAYLWWQSPHKIMTLLAIAVAASAVVLYAPNSYFERMNTIRNYEEDGSAQARIDAWKGAVRMAADNPVLGVGAGQFPTSLGRYKEGGGRYMTAHSMYFLVLGELGFTGLLVLSTLVVGNFLSNLAVAAKLRPSGKDGPTHALRRTVQMTNGSLIGFAVAGAFLSVSYYPHIFVLTGLLVSVRAMAAQLPAPVTRPLDRVGRYRAAQLRG